MPNREVQERVVRLFEESRQSRGAPFEEDRFMAFLTADPQSKGKRHKDSFGGCRRYWKFMNVVQLDLGVCFSNAEWDRGFSLSEFVALIQAKKRNPSQGHRLAGKRFREAQVERKDKTVLWSILVGIPLLILAALGGVAARSILGTVWVGAILGIHFYHARQVAYARKLMESVEKATGQPEAAT